MQLIITYLIIAVVLVIIGYRLYRIFKRKKSRNPYCSGCALDCYKNKVGKNKKSCH